MVDGCAAVALRKDRRAGGTPFCRPPPNENNQHASLLLNRHPKAFPSSDFINASRKDDKVYPRWRLEYNGHIASNFEETAEIPQYRASCVYKTHKRWEEA